MERKRVNLSHFTSCYDLTDGKLKKVGHVQATKVKKVELPIIIFDIYSETE